MYPQLQNDHNNPLQHATQIETLARTENLQELTNLHQNWLPAVEQTQGTIRQLSRQIRLLLETKRIMQLIEAWTKALDTRDQPPCTFMEIDALGEEVSWPFQASIRPVAGHGDGRSNNR